MADPAVDLWASDEVHFQQHGSRCRMWVPPETKDPILLHHPTRRSVGYFGAVRLRDGRFWSCRETGKFNAETFWKFMKQLQQVSRIGGRRVAVIADNARYTMPGCTKRGARKTHLALSWITCRPTVPS